MARDVKTYLQGQINTLLGDAEVVAKAAQAEGRELTSTERAHCKSLIEKVEEHKKSIAAMDEQDELIKSIESVRGPAVQNVEESMDGMSIGEAFVNSKGYKALIEAGFGGKWTTGAVEFPLSGGAKAIGQRSGVKTNVTETLSPIVPLDYQPGIIPLPYYPLSVADLIPQGTTNSNTVSYVHELAETNAAAGVTEANQKPESAITFEAVSETVGKIATFLPVSDEMLEDVAQMQSYLNGRLSLFVQQAEETALLSGSGAPSVTGILNRSGIQTGAAASLDADSGTDALYRAIVAVRVTGGLEPSAIVMHPTDWANTRMLKDSNNQYYGGGPYTGVGPYGNGGIAGDSLWGIPVVTSTAMSVGTVLVGAFRTGAFIYRRRGLTVEASNSHSTFFQYNLTAIRAEERLALAVYRPSAFFKVTSYAALVHS